MTEPYFYTDNFAIYQGDCSDILNTLSFSVDMIFADPPYFLSTGNGKVNINGQFIKFDKGQWDRVRTRQEKDDFNKKWLAACAIHLKRNGTIWVCGTYHNIFSVERCLNELGFKIINMITWQKSDPPATLSDKRFNFSAEYIIWATRKYNKEYVFNNDALKELNGGCQMQDVWKLSAVRSWEKECGRHPTQKPLRLLYRVILASTKVGDVILDPFAGSSTTGIAANLIGRRFIGCEMNKEFVELSIRRKLQINLEKSFEEMKRKMEENPSEVMVLINHARPEQKKHMMRTGICYVRAGDSNGSLLVTYGFERLQYVLIHTNGTDAHLYRLKSRGSFQIWTKETLIERGFSPQTSQYYAVFLFDETLEYPIAQGISIQQKINSYRAKIRPLSDFFVD